ncbi:MAG: OprO/OprP family phosphate-selective porin [Immundisolibacter sp.]|uniref:OprO/OprP family phosphate-selective porin n=1 Tax=Immundisolibacter sp. TaxID=1934948 RepID=UPI003D0D8267
MPKPISTLLSATAVVCALGGAPVHAREGFSAGTNGLTYRTDDVKVNLGGRLHWDAVQIDDDGVDSSDQDIRRARLELSMRFLDDWRLRVDREFTNDGAWRNVWLSYDVNRRIRLKGGNFIAPFSMEDLGGSNDSMFIERSLAHALAPGYGKGVSASYEGRHFGVSGGYFTDAIDDEDSIQAEKGNGVSMRATWNPIERRRQKVHLGIGFDRRVFDNDESRLISSRPEAYFAPTVLTTGALTNLDKSTSYNLEAAYSLGPVLVQGQYISTDLDGSGGGDLKLDGYYVQAGWVLTGERHLYSDSAGTFVGIKPRHEWGAVELAVRLSALDLGEAGASRSGDADDWSAGVNWYLGRNFRLMANLVHADVDAVNPARDRDMDILQTRAQLNF